MLHSSASGFSALTDARTKVSYNLVAILFTWACRTALLAFLLLRGPDHPMPMPGATCAIIAVAAAFPFPSAMAAAILLAAIAARRRRFFWLQSIVTISAWRPPIRKVHLFACSPEC